MDIFDCKPVDEVQGLPMVAFCQPDSPIIDFNEARLEVLAIAGHQIPVRRPKRVPLKRYLVNFY